MPLKPSQLVESPLPADLPSPAMSGGNHRAKILRLERLARITGPTSYCGASREHARWKKELQAEKAKSPNLNPTNTMILPMIHLNGTSKKTLACDYESARVKLREAIRAFEAIGFNGRDYYPQGEEAFALARRERDFLAQKLKDVNEYLKAHTKHISDA